MKLIAILILVLLATAAYGADIVTCPTANQLKAGQVDVAYYYLGLDNPDPQPQSLQAQTVYVGITDKLELDAHRYDPQASRDRTATILNATYLLVSETAKLPNVVFGGRNLTREKCTDNPVTQSRSKKASWFLSAAKNVTPMTPKGPKLPLVRVHASLGTEDFTLLGGVEKRHQGLFGGIQSLLTPQIGAVALWDGQDLISGLTYTPGGKALTIKGGGFGKHWWAGISYATKLF
jgi:hypothetical protein